MKNLYAFLFSVVVFGFGQNAFAQIPNLNSNTGSAFVLYIDMDGHTDNSGWWGGGQVVASAPGYNTSQATEVFNRVAEDFRPFDINVTTSQAVYDAASVANRQRVVVTPTDGWYNTGGTSAGGVAYLNTFGGGEIACWVFNNKLGNIPNVAEAASHELGHTLGLNHHARYNSDCTKNTEYHSGQGSGQTSWGPLMGTGYGRIISLWYHGAANSSLCTSNIQDDLKVITTNNGFNYKVDDVGNTLPTATVLPLTSGSGSITRIITTTADVDVFWIAISSAGVYRISGVPYSHNTTTYSGANLDVKISLQNSSGTVMAVADPIEELPASLDIFLASGDYYITVDGSGSPNYIAIGGVGSEDYGSLGQYTLSVSPQSCTAAVASTTQNGRCGTGTVLLTAVPASGSTLSWFSTATEGTALGSGNSYTTPSISASTTYYVQATNGTCTAPRVAVNATVANAPVLSALSGPDAVQVGNTIQLVQTYQAGTWSSSNENLATVSQSGVVSGLAAGPVTISYSATNSPCPTSTVTKNILVTTPAPCPGTPTVTDADGNVYNTIQIGSQCWTKENLKVSKYADNTAIPAVSLAADWTNLNNGAWSNYNNNSQLNATYGKLYNWFAVTNSKGVCPAGWHVPDQNEISTAASFLGGYAAAGGKMKSTTLWNAPNTGATNSSGFSSIAGGQRQSSGTYSGQGTEAGFWTVSNGEGGAIRFSMANDTEILTSTGVVQRSGQSVRCVKDDETGQLPAIQYIYASTTCGPGSVFVYATSNKGFINWYTSATGGTPIFTGSSFQITNLTNSTTFYAEAVYGVNVSNPRTAVTALVKPIFAAGTLAAGDQSFCGTGNPGLISFSTQPTTGDSATYKWYYQNGLVTCPTGSSTTGWTLIAGAESNTYDPPAGLTSSRTYAVLVTPVSKRSDGIGQPGGSGGTVCGVATWASGCRKITINALPVAAITPNGPTTFCQGGSVVLTASGGGTYLWSPGNTTTAQRTVSTSGNYSVLVTAANGCTASASVTVTVNSLPGPNAGPDLTFNVNAGNQLITGTPSGGLWSGTGVSLSGSFNTQLAAGTYKLAYCITNASNCSKCDSMVVTLNNVIPVQVATPVITPPTGTYSTTQTISISCATPGASIYYSATGNIPVVGASHTKLYTGPFQILQSATVRAIGVLAGSSNSGVAVSYLTLTSPAIVANPTISPNGGTFDGSVTVSLATSPADATIYYTTNGNVPLLSPFPNSFTKIYTGPIVLSSTATVRAIGVKSGLLNSGVSVANFVVNASPNVAPVVFSPAPGVYGSAQNVGMTTATPDAAIYYTTNGNVPRFDVPNSFTRLYTGPVAVSTTTTLRAVATKSGFQNSPTSVGIYTISPGRLAVDESDVVRYYFEEADEQASAGSLVIFPNPVSDRFTLRMDGMESEMEAEIQIYDSRGSRLVSQPISFAGFESEVSISGFPAGIYQVVVLAKGQVSKTRFVKH